MPSSSNKDEIIIALDAMGGDNAPHSVIEGADIARAKYPEARFIIYGDERQVSPILDKFPKLKNVSEFIHTEDFISNDEKPSVALRKGRNSSMGMAIKAVRDGKAHSIVSSGNTGAFMALSKIILRMLPGIDRPALGSLFPTQRGDSIMLDLGANVTNDANNLFEFAVMGDAFARILLDLKEPSIGLLNIGSEEVKGNEAVKAAAAMLRESEIELNFYGYIEGDDIAAGTVDVVVTDGFTGNVALKTAEGTAKMYTHFLKTSLASNIISKIGALIAKPAFKKVAKRLDPRMHNGAMFLGLNGIVVKSHGGTDGLGFSNATKMAIRLAKQDINEQIISEMIESGHIIPEEEGIY